MLTLFSGYKYIDEGECDRCAPPDPGCGYDYPEDRLGWNDLARFASWFSLFKELEFITKEDTVYTYLCAKGNLDLDPYCCYGWNNDAPLYGVRPRWWQELPEGVVGVSNIKYDPSSSGGRDLVDYKFPKELTKMADNYRIGRTLDFVDKLINVVCWSEISYTVPTGTRLPKAVITAVEGFNPVVSSLNSIVENCKALYATAIPETYGGCGHQSSRADSILKYDPSRNDMMYNPEREDYVIGTSFSKCHRYIIDLLRDRLAVDMKRAIAERDLATCNQLREAIVTVIGVLVYINAIVNGYSLCAREVFVSSQPAESMNLLRSKDDVDRTKIFSLADRPNSIAKIVGTMMGATPDAALCIGNMTGDSTYTTWNYRFQRLSEYLAKKRARPSLIVGTFLRLEAEFQCREKIIASGRVRKFKEGASK